MDEQKNPVESHSEEDFTFIKEKIKDKPLNKRRLAVRTFVTFLLAVLFGLGQLFLRSVIIIWKIFYTRSGLKR